MDLRVAQIKECEEIPGADRLYKLTVDAGEVRQIVAGIKPYYTKEELLGKRIILVANLEPRTLEGHRLPRHAPCGFERGRKHRCAHLPG